MGAILSLGIVLSFAVAGLELYIVHVFRPERFDPDMYSPYTRWAWVWVHKLGPWIEKSPAHGLLFSLGLSIFVGTVFPAVGVAVLLAGVMSTLMTQPVYWGIRQYRAIKERFRAKI